MQQYSPAIKGPSRLYKHSMNSFEAANYYTTGQKRQCLSQIDCLSGNTIMYHQADSESKEYSSSLPSLGVEEERIRQVFKELYQT